MNRVNIRVDGSVQQHRTRLFRYVEPLKYWLPAAVAATVLTALIFVALQQQIRLTANDPQIQIAEDTAQSLARGASPETFVAHPPVDITSSLATFTIVFDEAGNPIASGAQIADQIPIVPAGIFDYVRTHSQERVTWQPQSGVRIAAVVRPFSGTQSGFVLTGRSLREAEERIDLVWRLAMLGWLATLGTSLCTAIGITVVTQIPSVSRNQR